MDLFEDLSQEGDVFFLCFRMNDDIVHINFDSFAEIFVKDDLHYALKRGGSVFQAKWHGEPFVISFVGNERMDFDGFFVKRNVLVSPSDINR